MRFMQVSVPCALALAVVGVAGTARGALINGGFELDNAATADVAGATGWGGFNANFTTAQFAHSGTQSLKTFGPFFIGGGAGVAQRIPATPGVTYDASVFALNASADSVKGNNFGVLNLNFFDAGNNNLGTFASAQVTAATTPDVWQLLSTSGVAPAGAVTAEVVLVHVQINDPVTGGSVFWDDAALAPAAVPEPASAALGVGAVAGLALRRRRRRRTA